MRALLALLVLLPGLAAAQERGPVTDLPLPRYVSMKAAEGYARRGPASDQRVDWVFVRRNMPLRIVDEYGHWRRVQDRDGEGGWMHYSLLSGNRTVIVEADEAALRRRPDAEARAVATLRRDVVGRLGECGGGWCQVTADGHKGWIETGALWGVARDELHGD